jgi:hypothetical protein
MGRVNPSGVKRLKRQALANDTTQCAVGTNDVIYG